VAKLGAVALERPALAAKRFVPAEYFQVLVFLQRFHGWWMA
jgi:hypothetical protein